MPHIVTMTTSGQSLVGKRGCNFCPSAADNLVTACAVERPDGQWAAMLVNRDQSNDHAVKVVFIRSRNRTRPAFLRFGGSLQVRIGRIQTAPGRRIEPRRSRPTASKSEDQRRRRHALYCCHGLHHGAPRLHRRTVKAARFGAPDDSCRLPRS
jgi:hypothetical protein